MADAVTPNASQVNPVVIFDNVKYDVIAGPDDATPLVQLVRTAALQTIEVDKLVKQPQTNRRSALYRCLRRGGLDAPHDTAGFERPSHGFAIQAAHQHG